MKLEWLAPEAGALALLVFALLLLARRSLAPAPAAAWLPLLEGVRLPRSWRERLVPWPARLERLALLLLLIAALRPAERVAVPLPIEGIDFAICLDRSSSMAASDAGGGRTRLAAAQSALRDLLDRRPEDRVALVAFARWPDVLSPLTRDHAAIAESLAAIETVPPDSVEDATGIGTALARCAKLLAGSDAASRVVILLTDGEENVASAETQEEIAPLHAAQWCAARSIRLHAIVSGPEALDTRQVRAAALATGGDFFRAQDGAGVAAVCHAIDQLERSRRSDVHWRHVERSGPLLLGVLGCWIAALLLLVAGAVVGGGRALAADRIGVALRTIAVAAVAVALREPTFGREPARTTSRGDLVVCLDVSRSMLANDAAPTRLEAARAELVALAETATDLRLALVAFAGTAVRIVPLTADGAAFAELARTVSSESVVKGGSDLGGALAAAQQALRAADSDGGAIVLLTDGEDLAAQAARSAAECRARGIVVHAVGYGSPFGSKIARAVAIDGAVIEADAIQGDAVGGFVVDRAGLEIVTRLDEAGLQALVAATGGRYVAARDESAPLAALFATLSAQPPSGVEAAAALPPVGRPLAPWCVLLAVAAATVAAVRASLRRGRAAAAWTVGVVLAASACGEAAVDRAAPEWNAALAARASGDATRSAVALERAAAFAPSRFESASAFLRGMDAWEAAAAASGVAAIEPCRAALREWQAAALDRPDWDALRRDCERALLRIGELERALPRPRPDPVVDARRKLAQNAPPTDAPPLPDGSAFDAPPEPSANDAATLPATLTALLEPLPESALAQLAQRLDERETAKRAERAKVRRAAAAEVERDW